MNKAEINIDEINKAGELKMRIKQLIIAGLAGLVLTACESDKSTTLQDTLVPLDSIKTFSGFNPDPTAPNLPFPINILFSGTLDLTLNIPLAGDPSDGPKIAMNALDGFSTSAPITSGAFTGALDEASLIKAVRVFEVELFSSVTQPVAGPVSKIVSELVNGTDFLATLSSVDPASSTIAILPLKPLKPKTSYYVIIDNDLRDAGGNVVAASSAYLISKGFEPIVDSFGVSQNPSLTDAQAQALEPLRVITSTSEATVAADTTVSPGINIADIILSWSFTTQSIGDVLSQVRTDVRTIAASSGFLPTAVGDTPLGAASIHVGTLNVPYYLTASTGINDPTALGSSWQGLGGSHLTQFNTTAIATSTQTIPMMVTIPKVGSSPWPVVIYQHGITRKRADVVTVADALALAGFAVVAIDLPMHGITGNETDGSAAFKDLVNGERTFDLDLVDATGAPGSDAITDPSGTHFINLPNLLNSRDNIRQAASDLFALVDAINEGTVTDGTNVLDSSRIHFLGHSLGAIIGTSFLALETDVKAAALSNGGSAIAKILDGSSSFGPVITAGLASNGIVKGTADFETFLGAAQTVLDSGDPVNYSLDATSYAPSAAAGRGLYFTVIVGDSVLGNPSDLTVPITVPDANDVSGTVAAPLAGAEPQINLLGLTHFNSDQSGAGLLAVTKFTSGYHGSLIDPVADPLASAAVTTEMQTQIAAFLASNGALLDITDASLLLAP